MIEKKQQDKSQAEKEKEITLAYAKQIVRDFIRGMADKSPEETEKRYRQIQTLCEVDEVLPFDFKRAALDQARDMECVARMRECDRLLREASSLSAEGRMAERGAALTEARRHFARACEVGAPQPWRKAFGRAVETIQLSGRSGAEHSQAKPASTAPQTPNRAKL
jgi:hypothetical protein